MILIINGSPNKESYTLSVVKELIKDSTEEVRYIDSYKVNVESCDNCLYCNTLIGCPKKDDMEDIYQLMYQADTLIISSPIYFGGLSDQTMKIINRFQRFYEQKFTLKNKETPQFKNLIFIASQGGTNLNNFAGPRQTLKILTILFAPEYSDIITINDTDNFLPLDQSDTLKQINEVRKKMVTFQ